MWIRFLWEILCFWWSQITFPSCNDCLLMILWAWVVVMALVAAHVQWLTWRPFHYFPVVRSPEACFSDDGHAFDDSSCVPMLFRSYSPERGYHHSYTPSPLPYHDGYSSPVRSNSRRERDWSPLPTRSSLRPPQTSRDYQPHSNGRDHYPERYAYLSYNELCLNFLFPSLAHCKCMG